MLYPSFEGDRTSDSYVGGLRLKTQGRGAHPGSRVAVEFSGAARQALHPAIEQARVAEVRVPTYGCCP